MTSSQISFIIVLYPTKRRNRNLATIVEKSFPEKLKHIYNNLHLLTDWQRGFLESIEKQYERKNKLTINQLSVLKNIEDRVSPESIVKHDEWIASYNAEKRQNAQICAEYYKETGYFTTLAARILVDPEFIPSEKSYRKICENKYAKKVLESSRSEPKFATGSFVLFRTTAPFTHQHQAGERPCVVLSTDGKIQSSAKGSKPYKVLPLGKTTIIKCEERHLKKFRKLKKK